MQRMAPDPQVISIFNNLPTLETERLILRKVQPEDLIDLHEIYTDPAVIQYVPSEIDHCLTDTKKWLDWRLNNAKEGRPVPWAVVDKRSNKMIGLIGFCGFASQHGSADLMGLAKRASWNNGYGKEALKTVLTYGFLHMGLNRIESLVHPNNEKAIKLHEQFGFTKVGIIPECKYYRDAYCDRVLFTLLKQEFIKNHSS